MPFSFLRRSMATVGLLLVLGVASVGPARGQVPDATPADEETTAIAVPTQAAGTDALPIGTLDIPGIVFVFGDPERTLDGETLEAWIKEEGTEERSSTEMKDDGVNPDANANDGVFTGLIPRAPSDTEVEVGISDPDGKDFWRDRIPISADLEHPTLRAELRGAQVDIKLQTFTVNTQNTDIPPSTTPTGQPTDASGHPTTAPTGAPSIAGGATGTSAPIYGLAGLYGLTGLVVGFGIGYMVNRLRQPANVMRVGAAESPKLPDGTPNLRGNQQVWAVPDEEGRLSLMLYVARAAAQVGPVVIVPLQKTRPLLQERLSGVGGVGWLESDRPWTDNILDVAGRCSNWGRPLILVEGTNALEPADRDEPQDTPVARLLAVEADVLVLAIPQELSSVLPKLSLERDGCQLVGPSGSPAFDDC